MSPKPLNSDEQHILIDKGTEAPFTGQYNEHYANGIYLCRQCEAPLYRSYDKFNSGCGWPSFDDEIPTAIEKQTDADQVRTEILCTNCHGHLGHLFSGEKQTEKNTRHCVNSLSMQFLPIEKLFALAKENHPRFDAALYAAGCFWGVEQHFANAPGVLATQVGYSGGHTENPSYEQVCTGTTGHAETLLVIFDKQTTDYQNLTQLFFAIHDPSQVNRQGLDVGRQYRSAIFYLNEEQRQITENLIASLSKQQTIVTEVSSAKTFWPAEDHHQDYHRKRGQSCK